MPGLITRLRTHSQRASIVDAWELVNQGSCAMDFAAWVAMAIDEHGGHRFAGPSTR
jgi:hypothetical protein